MKRVKFERVVSQVIVLFFIFSQIGFTAGLSTVPNKMPDSNSMKSLQAVELDSETLEFLEGVNLQDTIHIENIEQPEIDIFIINPSNCLKIPDSIRAWLIIGDFTDENGVVDAEGLAAYLDEHGDAKITAAVLTQLFKLDLGTIIINGKEIGKFPTFNTLRNVLNAMNNMDLLHSVKSLLQKGGIKNNNNKYLIQAINKRFESQLQELTNELDELNEQLADAIAAVEKEYDQQISALEEQIAELVNQKQDAIDAIEEQFNEMEQDLLGQIDELNEEMEGALEENFQQFTDELLTAIKEGRIGDIVGIVRSYLRNRSKIKSEYAEKIDEVQTELDGLAEEEQDAIDAVTEGFGARIEDLNNQISTLQEDKQDAIDAVTEGFEPQIMDLKAQIMILKLYLSDDIFIRLPSLPIEVPWELSHKDQ